jgi:hypothetical protein
MPWCWRTTHGSAHQYTHRGATSTATPVTPTGTANSTDTPAPSETPAEIVHTPHSMDTVSDGKIEWRLDQDSVYTVPMPGRCQWWTTSSSNRTPRTSNARMAEDPNLHEHAPITAREPIWHSLGVQWPHTGGTCSGSPWRTDDFASAGRASSSSRSSTNLKLTHGRRRRHFASTSTARWSAPSDS